MVLDIVVCGAGGLFRVLALRLAEAGSKESIIWLIIISKGRHRLKIRRSSDES